MSNISPNEIIIPLKAELLAAYLIDYSYNWIEVLDFVCRIANEGNRIVDRDLVEKLINKEYSENE